MHTECLASDLADDLDRHFERLVVTYQNRLYAFAMRLTGSPLDAEEIVQDAFIAAYRALTHYPEERTRALALRPWLYEITLNRARNHRRLRVVRQVSLDQTLDGGEAAPVEQADHGPDRRYEQREQREELAALVAALPPRYSAAVILRHIAGLSYLEVAGVLGQPPGTVKSNVHRGLRLLRERLEERDINNQLPMDIPLAPQTVGEL